MAKCIFKRTLSGAAPADDLTIQRLKHFKLGELFEADVRVKKSRSIAWHRRYWALCTLIYQNREDFKSADEVHLLLKLECGLVRDLMLRSTGEIVKVPDSIAFDKMEPDEWAAFWNKVVVVVHQYILPGIDVPSLEHEIAVLAS